MKRWEVRFQDGAVETFDDEVLARSAHQLATGSQFRELQVDVPAVYRLWDPRQQQWVGSTHDDVASAAGQRRRFPDSQVRLVPA